MELLKANPDMSTWNLRVLLLLSLVCHPITWLPLHTGPSTTALFLLPISMATGQVPKRLQLKIQSIQYKNRTAIQIEMGPKWLKTNVLFYFIKCLLKLWFKMNILKPIFYGGLIIEYEKQHL